MGVGAHELVLLHALRRVLLDGACGLIHAVRPVRRRPDPVSLVFDRLNGRTLGFARSAARGETAESGLEFCKHRSASSLQAGAESTPASIGLGLKRNSRAFAYRCRPLSGAAGASVVK